MLSPTELTRLNEQLDLSPTFDNAITQVIYDFELAEVIFDSTTD
jgi:hypothetical protein